MTNILKIKPVQMTLSIILYAIGILTTIFLTSHGDWVLSFFGGLFTAATLFFSTRKPVLIGFALGLTTVTIMAIHLGLPLTIAYWMAGFCSVLLVDWPLGGQMIK